MGEEKTLDAMLCGIAAAYIDSATSRGKMMFIVLVNYFLAHYDSAKGGLPIEERADYGPIADKLAGEKDFYRTKLAVARKSMATYPVGSTVERAVTEGKLLSDGIEAFNAVFRYSGDSQSEKVKVMMKARQVVETHAASKDIQSTGSYSISEAFDRKAKALRKGLYADPHDRSPDYSIDIIDKLVENL